MTVRQTSGVVGSRSLFVGGYDALELDLAIRISETKVLRIITKPGSVEIIEETSVVSVQRRKKRGK